MIYIQTENDTISGYMVQESGDIPEGDWTLVSSVPEDFEDNFMCYKYANEQFVYEEPTIEVPPPEFYKQSRASAYPDIGDQLDALLRAGAFTDEMAEQLQNVKDAFPKPVEE